LDKGFGGYFRYNETVTGLKVWINYPDGALIVLSTQSLFQDSRKESIRGQKV